MSNTAPLIANVTSISLSQGVLTPVGDALEANTTGLAELIVGDGIILRDALRAAYNENLILDSIDFATQSTGLSLTLVLSDASQADIEIVSVSLVNFELDIMFLVRGVEGTTPLLWPVGTLASIRATAKVQNDLAKFHASSILIGDDGKTLKEARSDGSIETLFDAPAHK
ncbi:MAG: hypothetical protein HOG49_21575 [Candidatus Scalindua sp.]|nr:hypothetical protein [Candidatus Scalindua sp.]